MKKLLCFLLGHIDPVVHYAIEDAGAFVSTLNCTKDELYRRWRTEQRSCERCGVDLLKNK